MMMSELQSLNVLRGDAINGPYSMEECLDLCMAIAQMAETMEVADVEGSSDSVQQWKENGIDVAVRRKPLALAHSMIGSHLVTLQSIFNPKDFKQIAAHRLGSKSRRRL
jgi:hypothetical protein